MAGTRTSPLFTAAATRRFVTFHLIDASGDIYPMTIEVAVAAAAADIEGLAASYAAMTNASLYSITDEVQRNGAALASNAVVAYRANVESGINLLFTVPATGATRSIRVVAPVAGIMVGDQDIPDLTASEVADFVTDYGTLATSYFLKTAQYTGRRERANNPKVKP